MILFLFAVTDCQKDDDTGNEELLEKTNFAKNVFVQLSIDVEDAVPVDG